MFSNGTKRWLASTLAATSLATLSIFSFMNATPAPEEPTGGKECLCPPIGTILCCPGVSKSQLEALGTQIDVEAQTDGCFKVISCIDPPPCGSFWNTQLELVSFEGTAQHPDYGTVIWRNDPTKQSSPATFKSTTDASAFPAVGTISFYAEAEIEGIDGVFRSDREVVLTNNNVRSFNPFVRELFTRGDIDADIEPITFTNDVTGEEIILYQLTSELN
jgi:hypothetical protein